MIKPPDESYNTTHIYAQVNQSQKDKDKQVGSSPMQEVKNINAGNQEQIQRSGKLNIAAKIQAFLTKTKGKADEMTDKLAQKYFEPKIKKEKKEPELKTAKGTEGVVQQSKEPTAKYADTLLALFSRGEKEKAVAHAGTVWSKFDGEDKKKFAAELTKGDKENGFLKAVLTDYAKKASKGENSKGYYLRADSLPKDMLRAMHEQKGGDVVRQACKPTLNKLQTTGSLNVDPTVGALRKDAKEDLLKFTDLYIKDALASSKQVPPEVRSVYSTLYEETAKNFGGGSRGEAVATQTVLSLYFADTLNPALSTNRFAEAPIDPSDNAVRKKAAMNVCNLAQHTAGAEAFDEEHMAFGNLFIKNHQQEMMEIVQNLAHSSEPTANGLLGLFNRGEKEKAVAKASETWGKLDGEDKKKFVAELTKGDKDNSFLKAALSDYAEKTSKGDNAEGRYFRAGSLAQDMLRALQEEKLAGVVQKSCKPTLERLQKIGSLNVNPDMGAVREGAQKELLDITDQYLQDALVYSASVPPEVRSVYRTLYDETAKNFGGGATGEAVAKKTLLSQLFLRGLNPALTANKFAGSSIVPSTSGDAMRGAINVGKIAQNIANETNPADKEPYMKFATVLVKDPQTEMVMSKIVQNLMR